MKVFGLINPESLIIFREDTEKKSSKRTFKEEFRDNT